MQKQKLKLLAPYTDPIGNYPIVIKMDDTNNTPDVIDRNIIVGAIYLQPVKAGEFIELTFNIEPTGASFS